GLYGRAFDRVASIQATGPAEVTIRLRQPDYWLAGALSAPAGLFIEKRLAPKGGAKYGTPPGGIMCTGADIVQTQNPGAGGGVGVVAVVNPHYWNPRFTLWSARSLSRASPASHP